MILIGLVGLAGAGKTTVAEYLATRHGFDVDAFAAPLYQALAAITGIPEEELADRTRKEHPIDWLGKSPRELLQTLGTDWGRHMIADDLWVRLMARRLDAAGRLGVERVVIADVRFENEARLILDRGGLLWEVYGRIGNGVRPHVSERGVPPTYARRSIWNGGPWEDTVQQIEQAIETDLRVVQ